MRGQFVVGALGSIRLHIDPLIVLIVLFNVVDVFCAVRFGGGVEAGTSFAGLELMQTALKNSEHPAVSNTYFSDKSRKHLSINSRCFASPTVSNHLHFWKSFMLLNVGNPIIAKSARTVIYCVSIFSP